MDSLSPPPTTPLGAWLQEQRRRRSLSQAEVAAKTRIARSYLSMLEHGRAATLRDEAAQQFAVLFGTTEEDVQRLASLSKATFVLHREHPPDLLRVLGTLLEERWEDLTEADADAIVDFLRDILGNRPLEGLDLARRRETLRQSHLAAHPMPRKQRKAKPKRVAARS